MISIVTLTTFGILAVAGVAASVVTTLRDGYRRVPTRRA